MKTYFYIGAAVAAALSCSAVNAQVLGGNVAGGLGGTLDGGLRDTSVLMEGRGNGSFGGDLDTGSHIGTLRRSTSDIAGRTRGAAENVRGRTESTAGKVKGRGEAAASATTNIASDAVTTVRQTEAPQFDASSALASGANVTHDEASGSLDTAHQAQLLSSPVNAPMQAPEVTPPAQPVEPQPVKPIMQPEIAANGAASGNASASKRGASAAANGSGNASVQR